MSLPATIPGNNIAIVIPVYNEQAVIRTIMETLVQQTSYTIIVVDDGSDKPVAPLLANLPVTILRHRVNLGQGAALQTGFVYALQKNADIVITFDADGQHDVTDIASLLMPLNTGEADIVLGSRFLTGNTAAMPASRKILLQVARYINFLFSGLLLSDAHNGLRALNRLALEKISLTENRMAHASELLFQLKKFGLRIKEVPVQVHYTAYALGKGQRPKDSIKILFDLVLHKLFK